MPIQRLLLLSVLLLASLAMLLEESHASTFTRERRYAVIIGNNAGRGNDIQLRFAQKDALRFSSVLQRHGGLKAENTVVMLGNSASSIKRALLEINARIREENDRTNSTSTLIVYYSGHADADGLHPGGQLHSPTMT